MSQPRIALALVALLAACSSKSGAPAPEVDGGAAGITITLDPPPTTSASAGTIGFTVTDPLGTVTTTTCAIDSKPIASCASPITYTGLYATPVAHVLTITVADDAGNQQTLTYPWTITLVLAQQQAAATATAMQNEFCAGTNGNEAIAPFYWEIGDATSGTTPLASGSVGNVMRSTAMEIASASKMIFGTYALQALDGAMDPVTSKFLHMASGYDTFDDKSCDATYSTATAPIATVTDCYDVCCVKNGATIVTCGAGLALTTEQAAAGDTLACNSTYTAADDGLFSYSGGHYQRFAVAATAGVTDPGDGETSYGLPIGSLVGTPSAGATGLAATVLASFNLTSLTGFIYAFPQLAGGVTTSAAGYAAILQDILGGNLAMINFLGVDPMCAWTKSPPTAPTATCNAVYSPINYEALHYSYAHWVEDDPTNGDGAFSSPGLFGFYPWIDASKSFYGVIARHQAPTGVVDGQSSVGEGWASLLCGRQIRKAFLTGVQQ